MDAPDPRSTSNPVREPPYMDAPDPRSTMNPVAEPRPAVPEPRPEDRARTPQVATHVDPYEMRPDTTLEEPGYGFGV